MLEVFQVPATGNETKMALFIIEKLNKLDVTYFIDNYGNIAITKGKADSYPMFTAHIDTVHTYPNGYRAIETEGVIFAINNAGNQVGVSGDDKSGIYVCLRMLEVLPVLKVVFFSREESGGWGQKGFDKTFLNDCRFIGGVDRRGIEDFVTTYQGDRTVSEEFMTDVQPLLTKYNRKESTGMRTDALECKVGKVAFNMSAAYYEPHTSGEYVLADQLEETYQFCLEIAKKCTKVYEYTAPKKVYIAPTYPTYPATNYSSQGTAFGDYEDDWDYNTNKWKKKNKNKYGKQTSMNFKEEVAETEWQRQVREEKEEWDKYMKLYEQDRG